MRHRARYVCCATESDLELQQLDGVEVLHAEVIFSLSPGGKREKRVNEHYQLAANFISLMASKSCTPPPTRLVV